MVGCAELLFYNDGPQNFENKIKNPLNIQPEDYHKILPSPIPLSELITPYDVYTMYASIAKGTDGFIEPTPERNPSSGDIILLHFTPQRITKVFLLTTLTHFPTSLVAFFNGQKQTGYPLCMFNLGNHEKFQTKWYC